MWWQSATVSALMVGALGVSPALADTTTVAVGGYVAMGDSASTGSSGTTETDDCARRGDAFPKLLASKNNPLTYAACSDASTTDVLWRREDGMLAQTRSVRATTKQVTLTIGARDTGLTSALLLCSDSQVGQGWGCSKDRAVNADFAAGLAALDARRFGATNDADQRIYSAANVIANIRKRAPRATIYVVGYPHVFGNRFSTAPMAPSKKACSVNEEISAQVDAGDAAWLNQKVDQINAALRRAVTTSARKGWKVKYVDTVTAFRGHGLCDSGKAWINPFLFDATGLRGEAYQANATGMRLGYAAAIRRAGFTG